MTSDPPIHDAPKRVLLLDSDTRTRGTSALRLSIMDLEVLEASTPTEALRHWENNLPNLVVTDWPLGIGEDAHLLNRKLRSGPAPVVFCSSDATGPGERPPPTRAGFVLVPKNDRQAMLTQVTRLLSGVEAAAGPKNTSWARPKGPRQILVIEDSQTLRGIIRRALQAAFPDDEVREAGDGRTALQEMSQKKVDLIVTDLEMPGMDGYTFLGHLRRNPILKGKPVLVFSGKITEELRAEVSGLDHVRLLAKPADPAQIVAGVSALLEL